MRSPEKMIKIAIDVTPLQTEQKYRGVGRYVYNLIFQFLKDENLNKEIDLYLVKFGETCDFDNYKKLIAVSRENAKKELTRILVEQKFQIYHCTEKLLPDKRKSVKIVLTHHDIIPFIFKKQCFELKVEKNKVPDMVYMFLHKKSISGKVAQFLLKTILRISGYGLIKFLYSKIAFAVYKKKLKERITLRSLK